MKDRVNKMSSFVMDIYLKLTLDNVQPKQGYQEQFKIQWIYELFHHDTPPNTILSVGFSK